MSLLNLKKAIAKGVVTNAALKTFCNNNFDGKDITVLIDVNPADLPRTDQVCPYLGLETPEYSVDEYGAFQVQLDTAIFLKCNEQLKEDETYSNIKTAKSSELIDTLSDLVYAAINAAISPQNTDYPMSIKSVSKTKLGPVKSDLFASQRAYQIGITAKH